MDLFTDHILKSPVVSATLKVWAVDRKYDPASHTNHGEHQESLNSTDLLKHNNAGFLIPKQINVLRYLKIIYIFYGCYIIKL